MDLNICLVQSAAAVLICLTIIMMTTVANSMKKEQDIAQCPKRPNNFSTKTYIYIYITSNSLTPCLIYSLTSENTPYAITLCADAVRQPLQQSWAKRQKPEILQSYKFHKNKLLGLEAETPVEKHELRLCGGPQMQEDYQWERLHWAFLSLTQGSPSVRHIVRGSRLFSFSFIYPTHVSAQVSNSGLSLVYSLNKYTTNELFHAISLFRYERGLPG